MTSSAQDHHTNESPSLDGLTILVVEDDYFLANECAGVLRAQGATVVGPVPDAGRARETLRAGSIDCALLDINLKGEMVFEFAQELKGSGLPVIFTTGYDSAILPPSLQGTPCLQKPLGTRELVTLVQRQVSSRASV